MKNSGCESISAPLVFLEAKTVLRAQPTTPERLLKLATARVFKVLTYSCDMEAFFARAVCHKLLRYLLCLSLLEYLHLKRVR